MGWTKRQFVTAAFSEIGLASYVYDLSPEQLQGALVRMDSMLASWEAIGISIGYAMPSSQGASDLDQQAGVPDSANEAIYTNLAIKIAPGYGKVVSQDTKITADRTYNTLLSLAAMPMQQQLPRTMPAGAGNKPWRYDNPFIRPPVFPILAGGDGPIEFN